MEHCNIWHDFFVFQNNFINYWRGGIDSADSDISIDDLHSEIDYGFKLLLLNFISGFSMVFVWMWLACSKQFHLNELLSFVIAFVVAYLSMILTGYMFKLIMKLNSKGESLDLSKTIGSILEVYLTIPKDGVGKIKIVFQGITKIVEAVSENNEQIESFQKVV